MSDLLNSASLVMIPSGYKEDVVYSQIPTNGSGDLSFTRASNGTRINSAGLVEVCPWNLIEYSNTFSNSAWSKNSATVTSGQSGYDGTNNAWKLEATATDPYIYEGSFSILRTQSIYAKAGTTNKFSVIVGGYGIGMQFDLSNGTIVTNSTPSYFSGSISSVGNGWYYIVVTAQATAPTYGFLIAPQFLTGGGVTSGDYVFIQNAQVTYGSTAKPYFPTTDRLNVPRLTYQNGGGGCPSLLLEKQSTNLILQSEVFDNASWQAIATSSATAPVVTANYTISPDGTQNADRLQFARTGTSDGVYSLLLSNTCNLTATGTYTMYVKSLTSSTQNLLVYWGGGQGSVFQVTTEWTRITLSNLSSANQPMLFGTRGGTGNYFSGGDLSIDIAVWGAQLEASSYPTSYIPTTSSSATRVADACFKTGISSLIGQSEGVVFIDFVCVKNSSFCDVVSIGTNGSTGIIELQINGGASNTFNGIYYYGGFVANIPSLSTLTIGQRYKAAFAYKTNDFAFYLNGVQQGTDTSGTVVSGMSEISLNGYGSATNNKENALINQAILFPTRLTNAELQALTTI